VAQLVDAAFAALDVSHTGKITASDVMACAAGLGVKVDAEDVRKWISSHDIAGDGELSRDEFQKMMSEVSDTEFRHGEKFLTKL
jgi:Ca2+-binding EF-hand superfamily protein